MNQLDHMNHHPNYCFVGFICITNCCFSCFGLRMLFLPMFLSVHELGLEVLLLSSLLFLHERVIYSLRVVEACSLRTSCSDAAFSFGGGFFL